MVNAGKMTGRSLHNGRIWRSTGVGHGGHGPMRGWRFGGQESDWRANCRAARGILWHPEPAKILAHEPAAYPLPTPHAYISFYIRSTVNITPVIRCDQYNATPSQQMTGCAVRCPRRSSRLRHRSNADAMSLGGRPAPPLTESKNETQNRNLAGAIGAPPTSNRSDIG